MGDFANTIDSPANQMKIFKQQLVEAKVAITSLFIGTFAKILPYANAFLMVVKEVSKAIASMFGIKLSDYNTGIASAEDAYVDFGDSVDDATDKVKELKRQTLGFDQINNITENRDSGSDSSSISGGIDQRLLDAINGYDNGMDKVRMKATEIRDRIMEWLGFTKKINPLTGETFFEYKGIEKTLKNIWNSFKGLSTEGKVLVGLGLAVGATKLWNVGKKLVSVFGSSGLVKATKSLISPMSSLFNWMKLGVQVNGKFTTGLKDGINAWKEQNVLVKNADGSLDKWKTTMNGATIAVKGLITGAVGLYTVHQSMKNLSIEGANLANVLGLVGGSLTTIASGVQIGSMFGKWGAVIGGATGALTSLISAMNGYQDEIDKMIAKDKEKIESLNTYLESLDNERKVIQENLNANLAMTAKHETLVSELESIADANGKVKKGYEERAEYILGTLQSAYGIEYEMIDGQISNYDTLVRKIKDTIQAKNAEILADANKEQYAKDLAEETKLWNEKTDAIKEHQKYSNQLIEKEKELAEVEKQIEAYMKSGLGTNTLLKAEKKQLQKEIEKLSEQEQKWAKISTSATNEYMQNITRQTQYSKLQTAIITGNHQEIEKAVREYTNAYVTEDGIIQLTLSQRLQKEQETAEIILDVYKQKYGNDIPEELRNSAYVSLNEVINNLVQQTNEVKDGKYSNELIKSWYTLGEKNKEKFMEKLGELPESIQKDIINQMYSKGYNISSELQKGISQINPTINIDANTSRANFKIKDFLNKISSRIETTLGIVGVKIDIPQFANGGFPEDGWFRASHGELMGKFDNGKSVVANNQQIISGIEEAAYRGYMRAISESGMSSGYSNQIDVHVHTDEGTVVDRINQKTKQTGVCPINMPY